MHRLLKSLVAAAMLVSSFVGAGSAFADPPVPSHFHWRNTNYAGHYVLYDFVSRTFVETVNCQAMWHFTEVSNSYIVLTLYDASRGMYMRLDYSGMYLKASGASDFSFYQTGTFDTRTQFQHFDAQGTYTGAITKGMGCGWEEWFPGASGPAFRFVEKDTTASSAELYDGSRDLWVRLDATTMWLRQGADPYGFFKNGHW